MTKRTQNAAIMANSEKLAAYAEQENITLNEAAERFKAVNCNIKRLPGWVEEKPKKRTTTKKG